MRQFSLNVTLRAEDHVTSAVYRVVTCSQSLTEEEARNIGLSEREQRKLIPWGGVATRLHGTEETDAKTEQARDQSYLFCSLPGTYRAPNIEHTCSPLSRQ